jgi:hypothetical protein
MIAICPAGPPKEISPSRIQKRAASANAGTGDILYFAMEEGTFPITLPARHQAEVGSEIENFPFFTRWR